MIRNHTIKTVQGTLFLLAVILVSYGGWRMTFDYLHPFPYCNISIKTHILKGDARSIREAVHTLRRNDPASYKTLCRTITKIEEKRCYDADGHIDKGAFSKTHEGCFVQGTRALYVKPQKYSEEAVRERVETLRMLGKVAEDFWMKEGR